MNLPKHRFDAQFPNLKGCLFIVTYGRSGSTLMQNMLMTIPGCTLRGENHNVMLPIFEACQKIKKTKATWHKAGAEPSHPWYGADTMAPLRFTAALVDAFVKHVLNPPKDARWIGFKEIRFNAMDDKMFDVLDFMRANFKNAHIVMSTRNKDQVMKSGWWPKHDPVKVAGMIDRMDKKFREYNRLHPKSTSLVDYADFSRDPATMKPVFEALGETYDEDALRAVMANRLSH